MREPPKQQARKIKEYIISPQLVAKKLPERKKFREDPGWRETAHPPLGVKEMQ